MGQPTFLQEEPFPSEGEHSLQGSVNMRLLPALFFTSIIQARAVIFCFLLTGVIHRSLQKSTARERSWATSMGLALCRRLLTRHSRVGSAANASPSACLPPPRRVSHQRADPGRHRVLLL